MDYSEEITSVVFEKVSESMSEVLAQVGDSVESENWIEAEESNKLFNYYHSCQPNLRLDDSSEYLETTITQMNNELSVLLSYVFFPKEYGVALDEVGDIGLPFFLVSTRVTRKLTQDEMNPEDTMIAGTINQLVHTAYETLRSDEELTDFRILEVDIERHEEVEGRVNKLLELKIAELGWDIH